MAGAHLAQLETGNPGAAGISGPVARRLQRRGGQSRACPAGQRAAAALLAAAFAGFTQELDQLGMDQPDATMPALTGHRDSDWDAFAAVYGKVTSQLPASPAQRQELGAATMTAMVASLDNYPDDAVMPMSAVCGGPAAGQGGALAA